MASSSRASVAVARASHEIDHGVIDRCVLTVSEAASTVYIALTLLSIVSENFSIHQGFFKLLVWTDRGSGYVGNAIATSTRGVHFI